MNTRWIDIHKNDYFDYYLKIFKPNTENQWIPLRVELLTSATLQILHLKNEQKLLKMHSICALPIILFIETYF